MNNRLRQNGRKNMNPTQQSYEYQQPAGSGARKALKIAGTAVLAVALLFGISAGVVLTKREAVNQASAASLESGSVTIAMGGALSPETISIQKGQSVTWTNQDGRRTRHITATNDSASQALRGFGTTEALAKGESYSYVFEQAGTYHYYDSTSSQIVGTVLVTQ
jgi:plastocyanin